MITGIHGMFYSSEPEALRVYLRDVLRLPSKDVGGGWLIFDLARSDVGVHPVAHPGAPPSGTHEVCFFCDDLESTVASIRERGGVFDDDISDQGYGWVVHLTMPGGVRVQLYQPKYE